MSVIILNEEGRDTFFCSRKEKQPPMWLVWPYTLPRLCAWMFHLVLFDHFTFYILRKGKEWMKPCVKLSSLCRSFNIFSKHTVLPLCCAKFDRLTHISGGSNGGARDTHPPPPPPPLTISFVFMQFSRTIGQNIRLMPHLWGWRTRLANLGSATVYWCMW